MAALNRSRSLVLVAASGRRGTSLMAGTLQRLRFRVPQPRLSRLLSTRESPRVLVHDDDFPPPIRPALPLRGRIAIARALRRAEPRRLVSP